MNLFLGWMLEKISIDQRDTLSGEIMTENIPWTLCMAQWCENFTSQFLLEACPLFLSTAPGKLKECFWIFFFERTSSLHIQRIRIWQLTRMLTIHRVYFSTSPNHGLIYRLLFVWNHCWRIPNISGVYLWKDLRCPF